MGGRIGCDLSRVQEKICYYLDSIEEGQPTRHILDNFDFYKLRRELYWLELHNTNDTEIASQDPSLKLPDDILDWTQWIKPKYETHVGRGGYGDAFLGEWKGLAKSNKEIPQVIIKVMRVNKVTQRNAMKWYKVLPTSCTLPSHCASDYNLLHL